MCEGRTKLPILHIKMLLINLLISDLIRFKEEKSALG